MELSEQNGNSLLTKESQFTIQDLPNEILKNIFIELCPHREFDTVGRVCQRWRMLIEDVRRIYHRKFLNMFGDHQFTWADMKQTKLKGTPSLCPRMMYSICFNHHTRALYLFGGKVEQQRNASASFNDFWKFSLFDKKWTRPLLSGDFPPPKYSATLNSHESCLYLFGGSSLSMANPFTMLTNENTSNDLHIFNVDTCRWKQHSVLQSESPIAVQRHRSCVIVGQDSEDTCLFVFGGLTNIRNEQTCSDKIWCFEFSTMKWASPIIIGTPPPARHSHGQVSIQTESSYSGQVLIAGGVDSTGVLIYHDAYLLQRTGYAEWTSMRINIDNGPNNFVPPPVAYVSPAVKVGNFLVFVSPSVKDKLPENYHGNIATIYEEDTIHSNGSRTTTATDHSPLAQHRNPLCLYVLEFTDECKAKWRCPFTDNNRYITNLVGPTRPNYYTATVAEDEVIILGNSLLDTRQNRSNRATNAIPNVSTPLYFISPDIS